MQQIQILIIVEIKPGTTITKHSNSYLFELCIWKVSIKWYYLFFKKLHKHFMKSYLSITMKKYIQHARNYIFTVQLSLWKAKNLHTSILQKHEKIQWRQYYGINLHVVFARDSSVERTSFKRSNTAMKMLQIFKYLELSFVSKKESWPKSWPSTRLTLEKVYQWKVDLQHRKLDIDLKQWHPCLDKKWIYSKELLA